MTWSPITAFGKTVIVAADAAAERALQGVPPLTDTPRYIKYSAGWAARPADSRMTIWTGGSAASNAPTDLNLAVGDIWIPATA